MTHREWAEGRPVGRTTAFANQCHTARHEFPDCLSICIKPQKDKKHGGSYMGSFMSLTYKGNILFPPTFHHLKLRHMNTSKGKPGVESINLEQLRPTELPSAHPAWLCSLVYKQRRWRTTTVSVWLLPGWTHFKRGRKQICSLYLRANEATNKRWSHSPVLPLGGTLSFWIPQVSIWDAFQ